MAALGDPYVNEILLSRLPLGLGTINSLEATLQITCDIAPPHPSLPPTPPSLLYTPPSVPTSSLNSFVSRYHTRSKVKKQEQDHVSLDIIHSPPTPKPLRGHPSFITLAQSKVDDDISLGKQSTIPGVLRAREAPSDPPP